MRGRIGGALAVTLIAACATAPPPPATRPSGDSVEALAAAIHDDSQRSERESDPSVREQLASAASRDADACLALDPQAAGCLYGHALALGLQARAHPARAPGLLNDMLAALTSAEAADPNYDQAGPARVKALVLLRAPGWPLGPGDAEGGLVAAHRAVSLRPEYPGNLLTLAEALAKTGDSAAAREYYARARAAAQNAAPGSERESWLREADEALQKRR